MAGSKGTIRGADLTVLRFDSDTPLFGIDLFCSESD